MTTKLIKMVAELLPDRRNVNKGTDRGNAMVAHSLRACGAGRSILIDKHGRVIAGNKTVANAIAAGVDQVQVVQTDGTKLVAVQRTDLDLEADPRARELALLDNRTSEIGLDWDGDMVAAIEAEGLDLSALFTDDELDGLIGAAKDTDAITTAPESFESIDESLATAYQCPKCGYEWSGQPK